MKHALWSGLLPVVVVILLARLAGIPRDHVQAMAAPPLSLDGYRGEKLPTGPHDSARASAINEDCYVCHGNYRTVAKQDGLAKAGLRLAKVQGRGGVGDVLGRVQNADSRNGRKLRRRWGPVRSTRAAPA